MMMITIMMMMLALLQLSAAELEGLLEVGEEELRENLQGDAVMEEPVPVMWIISYLFNILRAVEL